jgi:uncharacterized protein (TIGR03663 family)
LTTRIKRKFTSPAPAGSSQPVILTPPAEASLAPVEARPVALPWLTIETLLYALILVAGLGLRLAWLEAYPLSNAEAAQSLVALQLYRGLPVESALYSPLLASLNAFTFFLMGATDSTARLATVLLGMLLVILPVTLRRQLGPVVCLLASALLAFSPTAIFLSRTLNSEIGVAVASLMLVSGFFNWVDTGRQRWLLLAAGGLALLLTAGPMAYSVLLIFTIIGLIKLSAFKALWRQGVQRSQPHQPAPRPSTDSPETQLDESASIPHPPSSIRHPLSSILFFFLVGLVLLATAAAFNLGGLGQLSSFLTDWLSRFSWQPRPEAGFNAIFLLTIYELLLVLAGLAGLALAILDRSLLKFTLAGWLIGLLVVDSLMVGRPNHSVILPLAPLALLAAIALAELGRSLRSDGSWGNEGLLLAAGLVIGSFAYIGLTGWLIRTCPAEDTICQYAWLQPVAALVLWLIIVVFFWFLSGPGPALRGAALAVVALGLMGMMGVSWRLNYGPLTHLAYQPLAGIPTAADITALTDTLATVADQRSGGEKRALDVILVGLDSPALLWQLRDYDNLKQAGSLVSEAPPHVIIAPANLELGLGQPYFGQDFTLDAVWSPVGLTPKDLLNWLIYRQASTRPQGNQVVLWLRVDESK